MGTRSRRAALCGVALLLVLGVATGAHAGLLAGQWVGKPFGSDDRLKSVVFKITSDDRVKKFVGKRVEVKCTTSNGNFEYRLDFPIQGSTKVDDDGAFFLKSPTQNFNGEVKARGEATELGTAIKGRMRVTGDVIVEDADIGDCDSGVIAWKAKQV